MEWCVMDHDADAPGSRWARDARPGQEVVFGKPEGSFVLCPAAYHLFVGEVTASVPSEPCSARPDGTSPSAA